VSAPAGCKMLFVVNSAEFFCSHRLPLAEAARARGVAVAIVCGRDTGEAVLRRAGFTVRAIPLSRSTVNPLREWLSYRALARVYREERPDLVHHVTVKPVIYGTRAARVGGVGAVVNAVTGLGFVFTSPGLRGRVMRAIVSALYRRALVHPNMAFIFQNEDDRERFLADLSIPPSAAHLVRGSGVDLVTFAPAPEPEEPPVFVLVARMLGDKGVREFVGAAATLRATHPDWRFVLIGDVDPGNPSSLARDQLERWRAEGVVDWLGHQEDVAARLAGCHVVVLPSYREGLPKSLIEAAAAGRPAVTTDVPGCREVVVDGVTGLVVSPRDEIALAAAMRRLGEDAALRARMGRAARLRAEALYGLDGVVCETFRIYESVLAVAAKSS
jgi:glycosyltransferase involved in cell wall biosynthesis